MEKEGQRIGRRTGLSKDMGGRNEGVEKKTIGWTRDEGEKKGRKGDQNEDREERHEEYEMKNAEILMEMQRRNMEEKNKYTKKWVD